MSKLMQIDVRIQAVYGSAGLRGNLPNLSKLLKDHRYDRVLDEEPSLYQMAEVLSRIAKDPAIPEGEKRPVLKMMGRIVEIRDTARELLLARRLDELDKALYRMEDCFKDLEQELD
ncbi:hypothetical protein [Syntrophobacter fumaroxidans]|uniref:Uncharacterized protein n=1 Tax=Syntrophobacter fumaroxidans (strain DSM 10017 / MPOB) TaxID=335543 RepID=A0LHR2_SYNFM|nr:hypothetical protein [Syntrophobacter fumaroxidans]ABK16964.1 hypothetical protein Sfum_1272 [Syntrophobacter fumaroxidans MPOB]